MSSKRAYVFCVEKMGLRRKLNNNLSPEAASLAHPWDIGECIATYWRPNFDVTLYPYLPAHITRPKEVKKLYLISLPEKCYLAVRLELYQMSICPETGFLHILQGRTDQN